MEQNEMVASAVENSEKETGATMPSSEKKKRGTEAKDRQRNCFLAGVSFVVVFIVVLSSAFYGDEFFGTDAATGSETETAPGIEQNAVPSDANAASTSAQDTAADSDTEDEAATEENAVPSDANATSTSAQDTVADSDTEDEADTEENAVPSDANATSTSAQDTVADSDTEDEANTEQNAAQPEDRDRIRPNWELQHLIPYTTCLAGVLLFIMGTARAKRDEWNLYRYWGEHAYRVAQAFAYLFVVWWAWSKVASDSDGGLSGTYIRPNILGFLVGFFILRVERAMDGLGDKFEQILMAVLPRAAQYTIHEERRRNQVQAGYRLNDIVTQWDAFAVQIGNQGAKAEFEGKLEKALEAAAGSDPERARRQVARVSRMFEQLKSDAGWDIVAVDDLSLAARSSESGQMNPLDRRVNESTPEADKEQTPEEGNEQQQPAEQGREEKGAESTAESTE